MALVFLLHRVLHRFLPQDRLSLLQTGFGVVSIALVGLFIMRLLKVGASPGGGGPPGIPGGPSGWARDEEEEDSPIRLFFVRTSCPIHSTCPSLETVVVGIDSSYSRTTSCLAFIVWWWLSVLQKNKHDYLVSKARVLISTILLSFQCFMDGI